MLKLIILLIPLGLAIFVRSEWLYVSALLFFIFFFKWIIKSNKQQPGETDEDYAKRMEKLKIAMQNNNLPKYEYKNPIDGNPFLVVRKRLCKPR